MLDFNYFPAMGYIPFKILPAPVFLFPPEPIAIRNPELGHLGRNAWVN